MSVFRNPQPTSFLFPGRRAVTSPVQRNPDPLIRQQVEWNVKQVRDFLKGITAVMEWLAGSISDLVFGGVSVPTDSVLRISCESFCTFHDFLKNPRPLVPEATALPTEPQALPTLFMLFQFHSF